MRGRDPLPTYLHRPADGAAGCWIEAFVGMLGCTEQQLSEATFNALYPDWPFSSPIPDFWETPKALAPPAVSGILYQATGLLIPPCLANDESPKRFAALSSDGLYLVGGYGHIVAAAIQNGEVIEYVSNFDQAGFSDKWMPCLPINYPPVEIYWRVGGLVSTSARREAELGVITELTANDLAEGLLFLLAESKRVFSAKQTWGKSIDGGVVGKEVLYKWD